MDSRGLLRSQKEVLDCLEFSTWKTVGELSKEIGAAREKAGRRQRLVRFFSFLGKERARRLILNAGMTPFVLHEFEGIGWVEHRTRHKLRTKDPPRRVEVEIQEYALTQKGARDKRHLGNS